MEKKVLIILALVAITSLIYYFSLQETYPYQTEISGVRIYSKFPPNKLVNKTRIAPFKNEDKDAITCNFEISAISQVDETGYRVYIKEGKKEIYLHQTSAYLKGTGSEILPVCHVFSCLLSGINCPENFSDINLALSHDSNINLILDGDLKQKGIEAYSELLGVLGFLQAEAADLNKDGQLSQEEKDKNKIFIRPYLKINSSCYPQQFKNLLQDDSTSNKSVPCETISSGIFLQKASQPEIKVQGHKVILYGGEKSIYPAAIILRDVLSPQWIRTLYRLT